MKQWISFILILLFSFQVLPVKELGKIFIKKNLTEQVQDETDGSSDATKKLNEKELDKLFVHAPTLRLTAMFTEELVKVALHNLPLFEDHFHPDISTPPPDVAVC